MKFLISIEASSPSELKNHLEDLSSHAGYIFEVTEEESICVNHCGKKIMEICIDKEEEKEETWKE